MTRATRNRTARPRRHVYRPRLDALEERCLLSTFQVTNINDSGTGSLREAILDNNSAAADTGINRIEFAVPGTGVQSIQPHSELPAVTHPVVIDGYTQAGSSRNTLAIGDNAVLTIELDGSGAGVAAGLSITADDVTVQGLVINRFEYAGIAVYPRQGGGPYGDIIQGCFIGTDPSGTVARPNGGGISSGDSPARIGTDGDGVNDYAERNLISGNTTFGVKVGSPSGVAVLAGNYIGTDRTGTQAVPNGLLDPVQAHVSGVEAGPGSRVGVDGHDVNPEAERNVISGNINTGVNAFVTAVVAGNYIGIDATGTQPLGNTNIGIHANGGARIGTDGDGNNDAAERNVISANTQQGIYADGENNHIAGNFIGTDAAGSAALGTQPIGILARGDSNHVGLDPADGGSNPAAKGNVISGNTYENVSLWGVGNTVAGNYIGLDATGTRNLASNLDGVGVHIHGSRTNLVGTDSDGVNDDLERNVISGLKTGVEIVAGDDNVVAGNFIGTDKCGTALPLPNGGFGNDEGIDIYGYGSGNRIGVDPSAANPTAGRNVISGNRVGIGFTGSSASDISNNTIAGNYLGTDRTGMVALANESGIISVASSSNTIGGTTAAERNLISGNRVGVYFGGASANNRVVGNWIGTDATGSASLGNGTGVAVQDSSSWNQIGGAAPGEGNVIAYNGLGVGVGYWDSVATGNSIRGNSIHDNTGLGIDLGENGVTANDSYPHTSGPNLRQNFPVIASAYAGASSILVGTFHSTPSTTFTFDFYASTRPGPSFNGQYYGAGQRWLGSAAVATDSNGDATFTAPPGLAASVAGEWISATATGPSGTSEFSQDAKAVPLPPSSLSGLVFSDFNDDGQVDFGEQGIAGVTVTLKGTDFLGHPVCLSQVTDGAGAYVFQGLLPGSYIITEAQPAGYTQGKNTVGTGGGTASGDQFTVSLPAKLDALNYNYGERPAATGPIQRGQTAGIGFWNNKNGQALIKALNGGLGTQLGDWLAATFPRMFGPVSGGNDLTHRTNGDVASFFQGRFVVKDQKLDAQVLATALAVYVTDETLDNTRAGVPYGFTVSGNGVATAAFNVGAGGGAFGVADDTTMTVMDILLSADAQAVNGVLFNGNTTKRSKANAVFGAINQAGGV